MKFITKLNEIQAELLASVGKVSTGSYLNLYNNFKSSIRFYLEENTGFDSNPICGIYRSGGKEGIENLNTSLRELLDLQEGDYLMEFDFPSDFLALINKESFELLNSASAKIDDSMISDVLLIDKPVDYEDCIAFAPYLFLRFCVGFCRIEDEWNSNLVKLKSVKDFTNIKNF